MNTRRGSHRWVLVAVSATALVAVAGAFAWYQWALARSEPDCPFCGPGQHVVPISYGYPARPTPNMPEPSVPRGPHRGCVVTDRSPRWHCDRCGTEWGRYLDELGRW